MPVSARLNAELCLVEADAAVQALQLAAGADPNGPIAPPQMAAIARLARELGEPVSRLAHVATPSGDAQLWVSIVPEGDGFKLDVEQWREMVSTGPRFEAVELPEEAEDFDGILIDERFRIVSVHGSAVPWFEKHVGQSLVLVVQFSEDSGGIPAVEAMSAREAYNGLPGRLRADKRPLTLSGEPQHDGDRFTGYRIEVSVEEEKTSEPAPSDAGGLDATLRSPLDRIIKAADQIVDRSDGPIRSDYADYAGDIATAGRHLLSVIRSMSEQVGVEREKVKLSVVAREAAGLVAAKAQDKRIDIEIEDDVSVVAIAERRATVQILVNILGNAIRHSPDGGTVAIVFDQDDRHAMVTIADQGPGIARADQKKIFEKFERLDAEEGTGAGLGLAISRRLAKSMDGDIELESASGEGARFTLCLPAAK
ncbi:sensor histidine kinase [Sphingomicrobium clamense]|uniref:histidine kinase n=1 Tax=Sphingomicrobium clamense TaxID=2851013 RepID=A0ABS6V6X4_9SPHN|nr:HAMP domain-containing sensor histidine kinase [Sphingomicrobium sp. B8]MBW0144937.1 HAMP domain-containing histidine kinase [Sphingomicrobium sp. B8]